MVFLDELLNKHQGKNSPISHSASGCSLKGAGPVGRLGEIQLDLFAG